MDADTNDEEGEEILEQQQEKVLEQQRDRKARTKPQIDHTSQTCGIDAQKNFEFVYYS